MIVCEVTLSSADGVPVQGLILKIEQCFLGLVLGENGKINFVDSLSL